MSERIYAAIRIESGLYIQPANDGERLFVVRRYEDGTDYGLEHGPARKTVWSWGPLDRATLERVMRMVDEDALTELYEAANYYDGYGTKREAVAAALESAHTDAHTSEGSAA